SGRVKKPSSSFPKNTFMAFPPTRGSHRNRPCVGSDTPSGATACRGRLFCVVPVDPACPRYPHATARETVGQPYISGREAEAGAPYLFDGRENFCCGMDVAAP